MRKLIFILFTFCCSYSTQAAHIIGGDVTYTCLIIDSATMQTTYQITMSVYRDSRGGGAEFDPMAKFGVFSGSGNSWAFIRRRDIPLNTSSNITFNDNPCIIIPPTIGVEKGVYIFDITLPWSTNSYKIAYQRCCRNNTITNLVNPGETGAVFSIDILPEAQTSCNNSPTFDNFPPIIICAGAALSIDQSSTDTDGDQLIYEFCAPKAAGGTKGATMAGDPNACDGVTPNPDMCLPPYADVQFNLPTYSSTNPLGASANLAIDPNTGVISGFPSIIGQYVVGLCVKEFRNGQLVGEIRRDFQFNVSFCEFAVKAALVPEGPKTSIDELPGKEFNIISCGPSTVDMTNLSEDVANIDGYLWEMDINGTIETITSKDASFDFPGVGTYFGKMILNPGSTQCSDTANLTINIYPAIEAGFSFDYDTCLAGPVDYLDESSTGALNITDWEWAFGDGNGDVLQNPTHQYLNPGDKEVSLIIIDDNLCKDTITNIISWNPVPAVIVLEPSQFIGCKPANIFFNNLSEPIDSTYLIEWTFGDGETSNDISPNHIYTESGIYDVFVEITSPVGCYISRNYPQLIEIKDKPEAAFVFSPDRPSSFRNEVFFTDQSIDAIGWSWNFAGIGAAFEPNPTFEFPDTGLYNVNLIVVHPEGCTDTITKIIDVEPLVTLYMPNAFTPNNDGLNDTFKGEGVTNGLTDYTLLVWNRWGALIFESDDPNIGWNGELNNNGALSQQGVYVYTLNYRGPRGKLNNQKGHITLIR